MFIRGDSRQVSVDRGGNQYTRTHLCNMTWMLSNNGLTFVSPEVYGVRHEFAAVEFEKVLDRWLEKEGRFDKARDLPAIGVCCVS